MVKKVGQLATKASETRPHPARLDGESGWPATRCPRSSQAAFFTIHARWMGSCRFSFPALAIQPCSPSGRAGWGPEDVRFKTCSRILPARPSVPPVAWTSALGIVRPVRFPCRSVATVAEWSPRSATTLLPGCFRRECLRPPRRDGPARSAASGLAAAASHADDLHLDRAAMNGQGLRILQADREPPAPPVKQCPVGNGQDRPCHGRPIAEPLDRRNDNLFRKQPAVRHDPAGNRIASEVPAYRGQIALRTARAVPCRDKPASRPPSLERPACPSTPRSGGGRRGVAGHGFPIPAPARR